MRNRYSVAAIILLSTFATGCASTTVVKNPCSDDEGIRFYRPKQYLLIKPAAADSGKVDISITQLPDYNEEYSIHIDAGLGTNNTQVTLDGGWNLTGLNVSVDSKAAELITAAANAATAVGGLADAERGGSGSEISLTVPAKNVPLGLYEAVVGRDDCGRRQLYGWRYVGFMPFAQCPVDGYGGPRQHCCDSEIYGLVTVGDTLVFQAIADLHLNNVDVVAANARSNGEEGGE